MLRPFVAYLRVYEPVSAFGPELAAQLREAISSTRVTRATAAEREQQLWLRSQLSAPTRILPGELKDGRAAPSALRDVLVLQTADVPPAPPSPEGDEVVVGPGPLVCPLEVRARSAAALVNFIGSAHPVLREASLAPELETVRSHASSALSEVTGAAVHILSSAYSVPLPWFSLINPAQRQISLAERQDPERQVVFRTAIGEALRRANRAQRLVEQTFGDHGPTKMLTDTKEWLEKFHPHSALELDYGGLVQVMSDETLVQDNSAEEVHSLVAALEDGDAEEVASRFEKLREFWGGIAALERVN